MGKEVTKNAREMRPKRKVWKKYEIVVKSLVSYHFVVKSALHRARNQQHSTRKHTQAQPNSLSFSLLQRWRRRRRHLLVIRLFGFTIPLDLGTNAEPAQRSTHFTEARSTEKKLFVSGFFLLLLPPDEDNWLIFGGDQKHIFFWKNACMLEMTLVCDRGIPSLTSPPPPPPPSTDNGMKFRNVER